ncbi:hypothetical protein CQA86_32700, partial [Klebsiella pneumoniae]
GQLDAGHPSADEAVKKLGEVTGSASPLVGGRDLPGPGQLDAGHPSADEAVKKLGEVTGSASPLVGGRD